MTITNDVDVAENVRTTSMRTRKSRVDIEIYYSCGAVVLDPTTYVGAMVLGAEGSEGAVDTGAVGNGAVEARAGIGDVGT